MKTYYVVCADDEDSIEYGYWTLNLEDAIESSDGEDKIFKVTAEEIKLT